MIGYKFVRRIASLLATFRRDRLGAILILSGLLMPLLIGFVGIGLDATLWYMLKRQIQTSVDAGVIAGAHTLAKGSNKGQAIKATKDDVRRNDFIDAGGSTIIVHIPPKDGAYAGNADAVEAIVTLEQRLYFTALLGAGPVKIRARAVASKAVTGESCVIGLHETMKGAVEFSGAADATIKCGITSNSSAEEALHIFGNAYLDADPIYTVGDIYVQGSATFTYDEPPITYGYPAEDPYADLTVPTDPVDCNQGNTSFGEKTNIDDDPLTVLDPGRYCGGIKITSSNVIFNAGLYIIDSGDLETAGTPTLEGTGVTFVFTATNGAGAPGNPNDIGGLKIVGGTTADLKAPISGDWQGILFYQDQNAPCCQGSVLIKNEILGGSETILQGAMYFPNQEVVYSGGSDTADSCFMLVANKVTFTGLSTISATVDNCNAAGITMAKQISVRLVE